MRASDRTKALQIGGWLLVFIGMFLPTLFIIIGPRWLFLVVPLACAILVFGLVLVSGRWPARNDTA